MSKLPDVDPRVYDIAKLFMPEKLYTEMERRVFAGHIQNVIEGYMGTMERHPPEQS